MVGVEKNHHYSYPLLQVETRSCLFAVILIHLGYPMARCLAETEGPAGTWDPVGIWQQTHVGVLCFGETWTVVLLLVVASVDLVDSWVAFDSAVETFHQNVES